MSQYVRPGSLDDVLRYKEEYGQEAKVYAGGTDLMVQMRARPGLRPKMLVDIHEIPELHVMQLKDGVVRIGAGLTHDQVANSALLHRHAPVLCDACQSVGAQQIRNKGTVGGNICNGSLAADSISALCVLNAVLELRSAQGIRYLPIETFYSDGKTGLGPTEVLEAIVFPSVEGYQSHFEKLGRRKALAISRINVAVLLRQENGILQEVRIAPGCVFSTPQRARGAETLLQGQAGCDEQIRRAAALVCEQMIASTGIRWSTAYKKVALESMVIRGIQACMGGGQS